MFRKIKNRFFHWIRQNILVETYSDLSNYLKNIEVTEGFESIKGKRILVLAPHPDDEAIGCGGTLKLLSQNGSEIHVLFLTNGEAARGHTQTQIEKENLVSLRKKESQFALTLLGVHKEHRLGLSDGQLHRTNFLEQLSYFLETQQPFDAIFCPWQFDMHSDHAVVFSTLIEAVKGLEQNPQLWFYETWSPVLANRVVNIGGVIETKIRAIQSYQSQTALVDYVSKIRGLNQHRSLLCKNAEYAEAFFVTEKSTFEQILRKTA